MAKYKLNTAARAALERAINAVAAGEALVSWLSKAENLQQVVEMSGTAIPIKEPEPEPKAEIPPPPSPKSAPPLPPAPPVASAVSSVKADGDVRVDREGVVKYPSYKTGFLFPNLEKTGPSSYKMGSLVPWIHSGQEKQGRVSAMDILNGLRSGLINRCLGLQDGIAIQALGLEAFRASKFKGLTIYLWRSAISGRGSTLYVPYLKSDGTELELLWEEITTEKDMANDRVAPMFSA